MAGLRAGVCEHDDLCAGVAGVREHGRHLVPSAGGDWRHAQLQLPGLLHPGQPHSDQGGRRGEGESELLFLQCCRSKEILLGILTPALHISLPTDKQISVADPGLF